MGAIVGKNINLFPQRPAEGVSNPNEFTKIRNPQSLMLYCPARLHYPQSASSRSTRRRII